MSDQKQSQFNEVKKLTDSDFVPVFGQNSNRKIRKTNLFGQIKDETQIFIYPTTEQLQAADLVVDETWPVYVRNEETEYRLYKITSLAPGVDDIDLNNGATATFQPEYSDVGFVVGPNVSVDNAIAVFDGATGTQLENGPVIGVIGENLIELNTVSDTSYVKINADESVSLRNTTQMQGDLGIDQKVTGPSSAANDAVALFDGITGKLIKIGDSIANYFSAYLADFLVTLYNIFPRKVNTWADIGATTVVGVGQILQLAQHTSDGKGSGMLIIKAGSVADDGGLRKNTATANRYAERIDYDSLTLEMFGAIGDGATVDSLAIDKFLAAYPSGARLSLTPGASYLINKTHVFLRPLNILGAAKENTSILIDSAGTYLSAPFKCGLLFVHITTVVPTYAAGDARRSHLQGFTVKPKTTSPASMRGIMTTCPIYVDDVDVFSMSNDGFAVIAGNSSGILGNANGCHLRNCTFQSNGGSGLYFLGDDANDCTILSCRSFYNSGWGMYDDSLLGNLYIGTETDFNSTGGYFSNPTKPNASCYIGAYAEPNQPILYSLNIRNSRFGPFGDGDAATATGKGTMMQPTPNNGMYSNRSICFGDTLAIADANGGGGSPGKALRVNQDGMLYRSRSGRVTYTMQDGANGVEFFYGVINTMRIQDAASSNLRTGIPHYPAGFSLGGSGRSAIVGAGTVAPTTGTYDAGAIFLNDLPTLVKNISHWTCITAGTPGVWTAHGVGTGTTANRPTLVANDQGYMYRDTTTGTFVFWNGAAWI